jgi:hypothetical protein
MAFQVGDGAVHHLEQGYGHAISLDVYRLSPEHVVELLGAAGFVVHARLIREPEAPEKVRQAYLLAVKPATE